MTTTTPEQSLEALLPQMFKYFNRFMILMWRMGLGSVLNAMPPEFGRYIVLIHTGRKSGLKRQTPVNYAEVDGDIYITAGFGAGSQWYQNMMAKPQIEIWMSSGWYQAEAEDVTENADSLRLMREVLIGSGFAATVLAQIDPRTVSDEKLQELTADYRLMRIRRGALLHGAGGPGDLTWVWGVFAVLVLVGVFKPKRKS